MYKTWAYQHPISSFPVSAVCNINHNDVKRLYNIITTIQEANNPNWRFCLPEPVISC